MTVEALRARRPEVLADLLERYGHPVTGGEVLTWNLAWSPDGSQLAYQDRIAVWVVDVPGGGRHRIASVDHSFLKATADGRETTMQDVEFGEALLDWSRDGRQIAYTDAAGLWIAAVEDGEPRLLVPGPIDGLDW